jgi:hypothetical protein
MRSLADSSPWRSHASFVPPQHRRARAFAVGCGEQRSPTAPSAGPHAPSLSVERGTRLFGFAFDDGRFIVFIALTVEDLGAIFCTGTEFHEDELNRLA